MTTLDAVGYAHDPADLPAEAELDQATIDALVGYAEIEDVPPPGARAVALSGGARPASLPLLDAVLDGFARRVSHSLAGRLGGDVAVTRRTVRSVRFADHLDSLPLPTQAFKFVAEGWGGAGLLTLGPGLAPILLDRLLGGAGRAGPRASVLRPPTAIETGILTSVVDVILADAGAGFSDLAPVAMRLEGPVEKLSASGVARDGEEVLVVGFDFSLDGIFGGFDLLLPSSALVAVRPLIESRFPGEKLGRDDLWAAHLSTEIWQADLEAEVVLHEVSLPLGRVLDLAVGQTLMFDLKPSDCVDLRCGSLLLSRGRMGRAGGRIAIQIVEPLRPAGSQVVPPAVRGRAE